MRFSDFLTPSTGIPTDMVVNYDEKVFKQMVDFITALRPEQLDDKQKEELVQIIQNFDMNIKQWTSIT